MTGDSVECFNCGRSNPSWAQVCRSCGVPMRPGGAGARPPSGPFPTDRDSLLSIGAGLATIAAAVVFGLVLSGMLPEAASVIESPTPEPTATLLPSPSAPAATESAEPSEEPPEEMIGTLTFGLGLNQSTREVIDQTDTFSRDDQFCHSISLPQRFGVAAVQEEVLRIEENGDLTIVQRRRDGANDINKNARIVGFCVPGSAVFDAWGRGEFIMRDYRRRGGLELLAEGRFTLE